MPRKRSTLSNEDKLYAKLLKEEEAEFEKTGGGVGSYTPGYYDGHGWVNGSYAHTAHPRPLLKIEGCSLSGFAEKDVDMFSPRRRVLVNCTGSAVFVKSAKPRVLLPMTPTFSLTRYSPDGKFKFLLETDEVVLDWPDNKSIPLKAEFWPVFAEDLRQYEEVIVCCMGGHGRTGTALACLLATPSFRKDKIDGSTEAVLWLRKVYCEKAVESAEQEDYIDYVWRTIG